MNLHPSSTSVSTTKPLPSSFTSQITPKMQPFQTPDFNAIVGFWEDTSPTTTKPNSSSNNGSQKNNNTNFSSLTSSSAETYVRVLMLFPILNESTSITHTQLSLSLSFSLLSWGTELNNLF
jgi:hypothetical protein